MRNSSAAFGQKASTSSSRRNPKVARFAYPLFCETPYAIGETLGLSEDFDGALLGQHDPVFADAGLGVNLGKRTVVVGIGDGDFDCKRGGRRVRVEKVFVSARDDGEIRLRFGVARGQRTIFARTQGGTFAQG